MKIRLPGGLEGLLALLLLASVGLNFFLARRITQQDKVISTIKQEGRLRVGEPVPPLQARTLDGRAVVLKYDRPTVIYVLKPDCPWCARNTANINALAEAVRSTHYVFGVTLTSDNLAQHLEASGYTFPVLTEVEPIAAIAMKLGSTPQTIVVGTDSKVLHSWIGAYSGQTAREIESFAHIQLPGVAKLPASTSGQ